MAVTLVGEIVNSADATTGYNVGNISTDDDFVEGSGAIGLKATLGLNEMYTTTLGATAPYAFESGGGEFGFHIIMWFNTKTPINATTGLQIVVGNGTDRGRWNVQPAGFYKGGFITAVIDSARDFDVISAGTWTTNGNPAQLTAVSEMGGAFTTLTSLMGNFNNIQLDQFTIGLGVRADAGSGGTPNTFETVRVQDEDTSFWGWWSSSNGAFIGKGKLFIGPSTGSATSVFTDAAFSVIFSDQRVAVGFYEISMRGEGTDVTWTLANIAAANASNSRWSITVDSTTNSFLDTNGVWSGADVLTLSANSSLVGTSLINCSSLIQNGGTLDSITVLDANTGDGVAFIESDDPELISDSIFEFSDGHAIEITTTGTYTFSGNTFVGYGSDGTNDAAIFNDSGGLVTLNVVGGSTPTVRNGTGASTVVNVSVPIEVNGLTEGSRAAIIGSGGTEDGVVLLEGYANSSGVVAGSFGGTTPQDVIIRARNGGIISAAIQDDGGVFTDFTTNARTLTGSPGVGSTDDVDLLPVTPAVNDAFYFGGMSQFGQVETNITTTGSGYSGTWEYWNGAWTALTVTDETGSFQISGNGLTVSFTIPSDWATTSINSQGPYFYIRFRVTAVTTPTQAQADSISLDKTEKYIPFNSTGTIIASSGLTATAIWQIDTNNRI
jgi:hypothetical protein